MFPGGQMNAQIIGVRSILETHFSTWRIAKCEPICLNNLLQGQISDCRSQVSESSLLWFLTTAQGHAYERQNRRASRLLGLKLWQAHAQAASTVISSSYCRIVGCSDEIVFSAQSFANVETPARSQSQFGCSRLLRVTCFFWNISSRNQALPIWLIMLITSRFMYLKIFKGAISWLPS